MVWTSALETFCDSHHEKEESTMSRLPKYVSLVSGASAMLLLGTVAIGADQEKSEGRTADEAAIRASAKEFAAAFAKGNAEAIAAMWTENGTLCDEQGQVFKGRKAIEDEYAALFKAEPKAKMEIAVQSIEFPAPNMAVEDGVARLISKQGAHPVATRYTAVHSLQDGKWQIATVRESAIDLPSNYAALRDLEWLVGRWELRSGGTTVENRIKWVANKSFLEREYTVREGGVTTSSGMQIIGWDPQAEQIHSWSFDSAGGHGQGLWTAASDGWRIESRGMLPDGTPTASQDRLIRVPRENDVFGWQSTDRRVGDARLPNLAEVVLDRVVETKDAKR
jgi:uncharacterized protein (TIGR02246 family)